MCVGLLSEEQNRQLLEEVDSVAQAGTLVPAHLSGLSAPFPIVSLLMNTLKEASP